MDDLQARLDRVVDDVLDLLGEAAAEGVELDPLQTIMSRLAARGQALDTSEMPPLMQMILGGLA